MKIESLSQLPNKTIRATSTEDVGQKISRSSITSDGAIIESNNISREQIIGVRLVEDEEGTPKQSTISKFQSNGFIRISGDYKQNFVDFPKIDIGNVKIVDGTSFKFFLSIKQNVNDANPFLYTSKPFYDELVYTYSQNNPYYVPAATKVPAIVVITLDGLKQKVEALHFSELNLTAENGVLVVKNLFVNSNFNIGVEPSVSDYKKAISQPTYNIDDIVRYVDWVVQKPNARYEDRLIRGKRLGRWKFNTGDGEIYDSAVPLPGEEPNNLNNPTTFPPFGRPGDYQNEIATDDKNIDWRWVITTQRWVKEPTLNTTPTPPAATNSNPYAGATPPGGGYGY
jgi:hypothetical protein